MILANAQLVRSCKVMNKSINSKINLNTGRVSEMSSPELEHELFIIKTVEDMMKLTYPEPPFNYPGYGTSYLKMDQLEWRHQVIVEIKKRYMREISN